MNNTIKTSLMSLAVISLLAFTGCGSDDTIGDIIDGNVTDGNVSDVVIDAQRALLAADALAKAALGNVVGAQSPRDIDTLTGDNHNNTLIAPSSDNMNLCDIHFHKGTEHKGGEFTKYAGNGDGVGYGTGFEYTGTLTDAELAHYEIADEHNPLYSGDTIEVHYVYSSNPDATLGNSLGTCLTDWTEEEQPLLRVEAQVYVLVNTPVSEDVLDFTVLNQVTEDSGHNQAENIPDNTGTPAKYEGSTTGPGYNEEISPLQVSWTVRPEIAKVNIETVEDWFHHNEFDEHHAHGVRNLVINSDLISDIDSH